MSQEYIGTKQVTAWPELKGLVEGYGVEYEDGYTSWSPKDVFEKSYIGIGQAKELPPHIQRLKGEKAQLDDRIKKLSSYLSSQAAADLTPKQNELMTTQLGAMSELSQVLSERLALG